MTTTTAPRRLKDLRVTEISLVDSPANQHARILIAKRDTNAPASGQGSPLVAAARRRADAMQPIAKRVADPLAGAKDVLARARQGVEKRGGDAAAGERSFVAAVPFSKRDDDQRIVSGWANVIEMDGQPITDTQGDQIGEDELTKAAHEFMRTHRVGKVMHRGADALEVLESIVVTPAVAKSMGMASDRTGWWITARVTDPAAWARVKSGELRALSIGGFCAAEDAVGKGGGGFDAIHADVARRMDALEKSRLFRPADPRQLDRDKLVEAARALRRRSLAAAGRRA